MSMPRHLINLTFPARDQSFGRLVAALSDAESGPHADNFVTNEDSFSRVCGAIARRVPAGGVYLGVGPDQNFTYLAHCRPALALILDYRRRNLLLHLIHKALFGLAGSRAEYLALLTARARPVPAGATADELATAFEAAPPGRDRLATATAEVADLIEAFGVATAVERRELATIQARLAGPGLNARFLALPMYPTLGKLIRTSDREGRPAHLLAAEPHYRAVRDLQRADRVIPLVGDFAGPGPLPRLADWMRGRGLALSLVYVSDVEFFLLRAGRFAAYVENLARLPRLDGALIVRTSTREIDHPERVAGDSSTTIVRPLDAFLAAARAGRIRGVEDLFAGSV